MSKPTKFPPMLHVTWEEPSNDDPFLIAHTAGVETVEEAQPCAIYKLVKVGRVTVNRKFEDK